MTDRINGECLSMCPEKERLMREREGLLHRFEIILNTKNSRRPKSDPAKVIKCYSRSAAGMNTTDPKQLRPPLVLLSTVHYMFTEILTRTDLDWIVMYNFVFDRLRAVRQDMVIQRVDSCQTIQLLEPIVRFYVYAEQRFLDNVLTEYHHNFYQFRLCQRNISDYDSKINNQHLLECIKYLLVLYDQSDWENTNRSQIEAIYILLYIGDVTALRRALSLPDKLKKLSIINTSIEISMAWYLKNYVRACRLIKKLPCLLICAFAYNLKTLRRDVLEVMSSGYNSKNLAFPGLKLKEILLYKDMDTMKNDCQLFGLKFIDESIQFEKSKFQSTLLRTTPEMYYTIETLHNFLPQILVEGT